MQHEPLGTVEGRSIINVVIVAFPVEVAVAEVVDPEVVLGDSVRREVISNPVLDDLLISDIVGLVDLVLNLLESDAAVSVDVEELPVEVELLVEPLHHRLHLISSSDGLLDREREIWLVNVLDIEVLEEGRYGIFLVIRNRVTVLVEVIGREPLIEFIPGQ